MAKLKAEILFKDLQMNPSAGRLYLQIYESVKEAILTCRLRAGNRLPSTRDMADYLNVSRSTLVKAFDLLRFEGYIDGKIGSGSYISECIPDEMFNVKDKRDVVKRPFVDHPELSLFGQYLTDSHGLNHYSGYYQLLQAGVPDLLEFPIETWARLSGQAIRQLSTKNMIYQDAAGYDPLKEAILNYLKQSRAVRCDIDQIIIINGSQQAVDLISRVLIDQGDRVVMEDPVYSGAYESFKAHGADIDFAFVDDEGADTKSIKSKKRNPKCIYLTPSHQFPLGYTMSLNRRFELLEWAAKHRTLIIEDDYDSEFRYSGNPMSSLQGMDANDNVIYLGTFSKVLFPSLRLGYMIVPKSLKDIFIKAKSVIDRSSQILEQLVLTRFIEDGHFGRYLRKMRVIYQQRKEHLENEFNSTLNHIGRVGICDAGIHSIAHLKPKYIDRELSEKLLKRNIKAVPLFEYTHERTDLNGLVLGYAAFNEDDITKAIGIIAETV